MNKRQRLEAAFHKQPVDRPPVALWRHFPGDDLDAEKFARRVGQFQNEYDFDFVKVTPAASYVSDLYGGKLSDAGNREGTRTHVTRPVNAWQDWKIIKAIEQDHPLIQRERDAIRRIRAALGNDAPILQTIFSPLACARTIAGDRYAQDLREHPADLKRALEALSMTMERFASASIEAGADALFFATPVANSDSLTLVEFREFGAAFDVELLNTMRELVSFTLLHIHGENNYFDELAKYPVQILNWHDRKTPPSLRAGKAEFRGAVAGGVDEWGVLQTTPDKVTAQVREAMHQTEGIGFIAAAGCVIPIDTPAANIRAARMAVES